MASEIFFLAAALILLFLGGGEFPAVAVCAVADRGFSWDLICVISSSIVTRSASSPFKASSSSRVLSGTFASPFCERKILNLACACESHWLTLYEALDKVWLYGTPARTLAGSSQASLESRLLPSLKESMRGETKKRQSRRPMLDIC